MSRKFNRFLAFLLTLALVTTTFSSDYASTRSFAVGSEEELEQISEDSNEESSELQWEDIETDEETPAENEENESDIEAEVETETEGSEGTPSDQATEGAVEEATADITNGGNVVEEPATAPAVTEATASATEAVEASSEATSANEESTEAASAATSASIEEAADAASSASTEIEEKEQNLVTVKYKASMGGRVSVKEETVDLNDKDAEFEGSEATPWNDKYQFTEWVDEDGNFVTNDALLVPSDVEKDTTFTAKFMKLEEMPAISESKITGGMNVSVEAEEGLFPEGTTVSIEAIPETQALETAQDTLGDNVKEAKGVDIKFIYNEDEIQPADAQYVHVSISLVEKIEGTDFTVLHQHDGEVKEIEAAVATEEKNADPEDETKVATGIEFDSNEFSVFIFAGEDANSEKKVVTYKFYEDPDKTTVFNTQAVKNGDTLLNPGVPKTGDNESFVKWQKIVNEEQVDIEFDTISDITKESPTTIEVVPLLKKNYYITFRGENGEIFHVETIEVTGNQRPSVDLSSIPEYIPAEDIKACIGWSTSEANAKAGIVISDTTVYADTTPELWASVTKAYWVRFDKNGSGATFTGAQRVKDGARLSTIQDKVTGDNAPKRTGYTFKGWSTDSGEDNTVNVNWNSVINDVIDEETNEYQLYAVWEENSNTTYTVIFWTQNVNDVYDQDGNPNNNNIDGKYTYDYSEAVRLTGRTGDELTESSVNDALRQKAWDDNNWSISSMDGANYTGFQYLKNDVSGKSISRNGDTVVNVYYTRKVITLTFNHNEDVPTHEEGYAKYYNQSNHKNNPTAGYDYYDKDGNKLRYEKETSTEVKFYQNYVLGGYYNEYTGDIYYISGYDRWGDPIYTKIDKANTTQNGTYYRPSRLWGYTEVYRVEEPSTIVKWYYEDGSSYTGDLYYYYENDGSTSQTVTDTMKGLYGQTLTQNNYVWPTHPEDSDEYYKWVSPGTITTFLDAFFEDKTFTGTKVNETVHTIRFFQENVDGDGYTEKNSVRTTDNNNFRLTNKYTGFKLAYYSYGEDGTKIDASNMLNEEVSQTDSWGNELCIYFDRIEYELSFIDVSPLPEDNHNQTTVETIKVKYGVPLTAYSGTEDSEDYSDFGYTFKYWAYDVAGSQQFAFTSTMPASNLAVYSSWMSVSYPLRFNPNTGTFGSGIQSKVDAQTGYAVLSQSPGEAIDKNELTSTSFIDKDGWKLVGWFYQNEDGTVGEPFPYEPIKKDTTLIAKWRFERNVSVVFDGADYTTGEQHGTFAGEKTYSDEKKYASDSAFKAAAAPDQVEKGYTFIGWKVVGDGTMYYPNDIISITEDMIDTELEQILVKAVYQKNGTADPGEEPIFIRYHKNFGPETEADVVTVTTDDDDKPLIVNHPVTAPTYNDLFGEIPDAHYDFLGWSASSTATEAWLKAEETYQIFADTTGATTSLDADGNKVYSGNDLYAVWAPHEYTVSFNLDGGTDKQPTAGQIGTGNQTVVYQGKAKEPTVEITKEFYRLEGWLLNGEAYNFDEPVEADITLKANWVRVTYKYNIEYYKGESVASGEKFKETGFVNEIDAAVYEDAGIVLGIEALKANKPTDDDGNIIEGYDDGTQLDTIKNNNGTLTVQVLYKPIHLTITITTKQETPTYDGEEHTAVVTATGSKSIDKSKITYNNQPLSSTTAKATNVSDNGSATAKKILDAQKFAYNKGAYVVEFVFANNNNENSVTIQKRAIELTANSNTDFVYDGTEKEVTGVTVTSGSLAKESHKADATLSGNKRTDVGTQSVTASNGVVKDGNTDVTGNYAITYKPGTLTINKAGGEALGLDAKGFDVTYDAESHKVTASTTVTAGTTISYKVGNGEWTTKAPEYTDVIDETEVTVKAENANYNNAEKKVKIRIKKRAIELTANSNTDFVYDGTEKEVTGVTVTSGSLAKESHKADATLSGNKRTDVGTQSVTASNGVVKDGNTDVTGNYAITYKPGTLTINKAGGEALGLDAKGFDVTYDAESHKVTASTTVTAGTTISYKVGNGEWTTKAPEYTDVIDETEVTVKAENANYNNAEKKVKIRIKKRAIELKVADAEKTYGEVDPEFKLEDGELDKVFGDDVISYAITRKNADKDVDAGTYEKVLIAKETSDSASAEASGPHYANGNYNITFVPGNFEIKKASGQALELSVEGYQGVYDAKDHTVDVVMNPELEQSTTILYSTNGTDWSKDAPQFKNVVEGQTVQVKTENKNYEVATASATVTISKRPIIVMAGNGTEQSFMFDGKPHTASGYDWTKETEAGGLIDGQKLEAELENNTQTTVGNYKFNIKEGSVKITDGILIFKEDVTDNYSIEYVEGAMKIASRKDTGDEYRITVHADNVLVTYNGKVQTYTTGYGVSSDTEDVNIAAMIWDAIKNLFTLKSSATTGVPFDMDGTTYTLSGVTVSASGKNVGNYKFVATGKEVVTMIINGEEVPVTDEFKISYELGELQIGYADAKVTADSASKVEGATDPTLTAAVSTTNSALLTEAQNTVQYAVARATGETAGDYAITVTGDVYQGNFKVDYVNNTFTITAATPAPTPTPTPDPTPAGGDDPTPAAPTPVTPAPVAAAPAAAPAAAVLGATREGTAATNGAAVLGSRRAKTDDQTDDTSRAFAIVIAAAVAISLFVTRKKKEEE
ncbi:InlB B-repeat-containing protein [Butyrivibrio sp.]|uniref:InlB B-repeat-containing protein n=1 Tax=Butyrivibrio sp. TaxID=28121 RepID=UPI0025B9BA58|nr:InlB B-repeat-containing protein [Butyrivibrio sp.]